jgi:peroxiredoxin
MHSRGGTERADLWALAVTCLVGIPLVYFGAAAFAEGEVRRQQTPLQAMIGAEAYQAWSEGRTHPQHYLGDDRTAPDFTLPQADGSTWRLSDHRGKVIVMNFWTTTCQPCVEEMPSLMSLAEVLEDREDIELVTVSTDRDWETVRSVVPDGTPMTVLLDPDREVVRGKFGTRLYPETWIIDPEGVIRMRVDGQRDWGSALALDVFETFL